MTTPAPAPEETDALTPEQLRTVAQPDQELVDELMRQLNAQLREQAQRAGDQVRQGWRAFLHVPNELALPAGTSRMVLLRIAAQRFKARGWEAKAEDSQRDGPSLTLTALR